MDKTKMFRLTKIELDNNGDLPSRFMLMQTGNWPNSIKGKFEITLDDLKQVKENFDKGIGFPTQDASTGLAIDFKHEYDDQAAGWIKGLELDTTDPNAAKLFANPVEWTDAGAEAVKAGRFKCVSPSGWFGSKAGRLSMWPDPQDLKNKVANVLDGAGLTNIPFLRGMAPIRASASEDLELEYDKVIFISQSQQKKGATMTIDELRVKDKDQLTAEELAFVTTHKAELSAEEVKKFELDEEPAGGEGEGEGEPKDQLSAEDSKLLADIKAGNKKVIDAGTEAVTPERLAALEGTAKKYETEKAQDIVEAHVKRGAIKQDAAENWQNRLLSATGKERIALEADLKALPDNKVVADEIGTGEEVAAGSTAREQLHVMANKKVEEAAKAGKELLYADALKQALAENEDLAQQDLVDNKAKVGV